MKTTPMLGGDSGTAQTVTQMKGLVNASLTDPVVVQTARGLAASALPRDTDSQAEAVKSFLQEHFMFVRDPADVELLSTPRFMLDTIATRMYAQGDCDEAAILGAALGKAIGPPVKFILIGLPGPTGPMAHVFTLLRGRSGWHNLDVTRPQVGYIPPATRMQEVPVYSFRRLGPPPKKEGPMPPVPENPPRPSAPGDPGADYPSKVRLPPANSVTARIGNRTVMVRNGTRLYVPGMLSDADQAYVDRMDAARQRGHLGILPLALAVPVVSGIANLFKGSAAGPNTDAAQAALPLALAGNLTAVKAIYKRATYINTQSSAAPWRTALSQTPAQLLAVPGAKDGPGPPGVPEEWVSNLTPQQVVPAIQRYTVMYTPPAAPVPQGTFPSPTPGPVAVTPTYLAPAPAPSPGAAISPLAPLPPAPTFAPPTVYLPGAAGPTPAAPPAAGPDTASIMGGSGSSMLPLLIGGGLLLVVALSRKK